MDIRVDTTLDPDGAPRPRRLCFDDRRIDVAELRDRWDGRAYRYYKLIGEDRNVYILRCDEPQNKWTLVLYRSEAEEAAQLHGRDKQRFH